MKRSRIDIATDILAKKFHKNAAWPDFPKLPDLSKVDFKGLSQNPAAMGLGGAALGGLTGLVGEHFGNRDEDERDYTGRALTGAAIGGLTGLGTSALSNALNTDVNANTEEVRNKEHNADPMVQGMRAKSLVPVVDPKNPKKTTYKAEYKPNEAAYKAYVSDPSLGSGRWKSLLTENPFSTLYRHGMEAWDPTMPQGQDDFSTSALPPDASWSSGLGAAGALAAGTISPLAIAAGEATQRGSEGITYLGDLATRRGPLGKALDAVNPAGSTWGNYVQIGEAARQAGQLQDFVRQHRAGQLQQKNWLGMNTGKPVELSETAQALVKYFQDQIGTDPKALGGGAIDKAKVELASPDLAGVEAKRKGLEDNYAAAEAQRQQELRAAKATVGRIKRRGSDPKADLSSGKELMDATEKMRLLQAERDHALEKAKADLVGQAPISRPGGPTSRATDPEHLERMHADLDARFGERERIQKSILDAAQRAHATSGTNVTQDAVVKAREALAKLQADHRKSREAYQKSLGETDTHLARKKELEGKIQNAPQDSARSLFDLFAGNKSVGVELGDKTIQLNKDQIRLDPNLRKAIGRQGLFSGMTQRQVPRGLGMLGASLAAQVDNAPEAQRRLREMQLIQEQKAKAGQ